jgi:hypothetical protein
MINQTRTPLAVGDERSINSAGETSAGFEIESLTSGQEHQLLGTSGAARPTAVSASEELLVDITVEIRLPDIISPFADFPGEKNWFVHSG